MKCLQKHELLPSLSVCAAIRVNLDFLTLTHFSVEFAVKQVQTKTMKLAVCVSSVKL